MSENPQPSTTQPDAAAALSTLPSAQPQTEPVPAAPIAVPPPIEWREGENLTRAYSTMPYRRKRGDPLFRPLRIYTLDPTQSKLEGATAIVRIPYEELGPGPAGRLLAVDPSPGPLQGAKTGVDLNDFNVVLEQGLRPSPANPQFHQQMVYAVCSSVYNAFRGALGRDLSWGFRRRPDGDDRLWLVPFGMPDKKNARYNKATGVLEFGYFKAAKEKTSGRTPAGTQVFTSLSHDIIAHEFSHALLDGLRAMFMFPSHKDVRAFHEAFADIVALFQHFSYSEVVRAALRKSKGNLRERTVLSNIAGQFGETTGLKGALRTGIDFEKDFEKGTPLQQYDENMEEHKLGAVLVAAVFDAFTRVFERKTARYVRLATRAHGTAAHDFPDELQNVLADQASRLAGQFLTICIRAIDYCPPVDIRFGDFLRAVITADVDLVEDDPWAYREAWIDAFRDRGIFPDNVEHFSEDDIVWRAPEIDFEPIRDLAFDQLQFNGDPGHAMTPDETRRQAKALAEAIFRPERLDVFGIIDPSMARDGETIETPVIESIRTSRRIGPQGQIAFDLIAEITQRRRLVVEGRSVLTYGGSTIVIGPDGDVRYVVYKRANNQKRFDQQLKFAEETKGKLWSEEGDLEPLPSALAQLHGDDDDALDVK